MQLGSDSQVILATDEGIVLAIFHQILEERMTAIKKTLAIYYFSLELFCDFFVDDLLLLLRVYYDRDAFGDLGPS